MTARWVTADGRLLRIGNMDLNHQMNALAMMGFSVRRMRQSAVQIFGENMTNVSEATKAAFAAVHPRDVYPLYDTMQTDARRKFLDQFGVEFNEVKAEIFRMWSLGGGEHCPHKIERRFEPAVRFMLRADEGPRRLTDPRLFMYVKAYAVKDDLTYADMCWALRADQPIVWRQINESRTPPVLPYIKRIPPNRMNSALRFESLVFPKYTGVDDMFGTWCADDIPFSAGR